MTVLRRLVCLFSLLLCGLAHAADSRNVAVQSAAGGHRVALVIGNGAYPGPGALKNPANDARDMAAKLKRLGFDVIVRTDLKHKDMLRSFTEFGDNIREGSEALFFYAGHGMQVRGRNYLIPVDADIRSEGSVSSEAVDVDQLLDKLAPARLSMVILDACRNNPFERRFRGGGQGLAQINAPTGTLIAYATAPGRVAADGDGRNGLYTAELLAAMDVQGIRIEDVFKRVRANVVKKSHDAQTPWETSSLTGDFFFRAPATGAAAVSPQPMPSATDPAAIELAYWDGVKDSRDAEAFKTYLDQYPEGRFAALAKVRVRELSGSAATASSAKPRRTRATDFLEGTWEYQLPTNRAHMMVHWNPATEQYEGVLTKHGEVSHWVGFVIGEVVWKASLTNEPTRLRETALFRAGKNAATVSQEWREGELDLERSSPDELVTSFGRLLRVGSPAHSSPRPQPPQSQPARDAQFVGTWVGRNGAWYQLTQNGNRMTLKTASRPVIEDEVRSTYSLVGNVPITQLVHAEFQLTLNGNSLDGTWSRAAFPADKCTVPADTAAVAGEWRQSDGALVLRYDYTSFTASTQMSLLGDDSCSGVATRGRKTAEEVIYGPLGNGGIGTGFHGLTSWWEGGLSAVQFGWQGRLRIQVQDGTPAHAAGLRNQDEILSIDGTPVSTLSAGETMARLHGQPRSNVALAIRRKGETEPRIMNIQRIELRPY